MKDRKERVFLIVEPGENALSTRKLILEAAGYNCISAVSGNQALKFFSSPPPFSGVLIDTDVNDVQLPELIDRFQQTGPIPIFLLSNRLWPPEEIRDKQVAAIFEKMSDPASMVRTIAEHYDDPPGVAGF